jgi:hypothetical protein
MSVSDYTSRNLQVSARRKEAAEGSGQLKNLFIFGFNSECNV